MKINLLEKIILAVILPNEGNIKTLTVVRDLKKKLQLSQDDIKKYGINQDGTIININKKGECKFYDIKFTEMETNEIKICLKKLDSENKLSIEMLNLVNIFKVE
jgi:hypothetical protein